MRSMDSILKDEPSVHTLPDGPGSDSRAEPARETETETKPGVMPEAVKAEASNKPPAVRVEADDADDEGDPDPVDKSIEGLRTALTAVRGDKRKMRKQWQEASRKADEASRRIAHLEGQIAALSQRGGSHPAGGKAEPEVKQELPDFYGNPDGHLTAREERILAKLKAERDGLERTMFTRDANRSEKAMRRQHPDYDEAKAAFVAATKDGQAPWLVQRMYKDPDPAEVVYEEGLKLLGRGPEADENAKLKARIAELEAASGGGTTQKAPVKPIPKSNAGARGSGNGVPQKWNGPRSMKEILA